MPLQPSVFVEAIRLFADPSDQPDFAYTTSEDAARTKWGNAFAAYLATVGPIPPTPVQLPAIATAFHDTLRLAPGLVGMPATTDFAAAWSAAMLAFNPWDDPTFAARQATLRATLTTLFAATSLALIDQLNKIVTAFHAATTGLTLATVPYT